MTAGYRRVEQVMGTAVSLLIADPLPGAQLAGLADATFAWLHEVDARFSTYRPDSEVNRLDRGEIDPARTPATCVRYWPRVPTCGGPPTGTSTRTRPGGWTRPGTSRAGPCRSPRTCWWPPVRSTTA